MARFKSTPRRNYVPVPLRRARVYRARHRAAATRIAMAYRRRRIARRGRAFRVAHLALNQRMRGRTPFRRIRRYL